MKGWRYESYRHSLASKGIKTSFVANSRKGWRSRPEDLVWSEKHGRYVDWRKVAAAEGVPTGSKRNTLKGDTFGGVPGVNIYEGQPEEEAQPGFTQFTSLPRQVTLPVVPPLVQEFREPPVPISSQLSTDLSSYKQQAQPVEDGLPAGEVQSPPLMSVPGMQIGEDVMAKKIKPTANELPSMEDLDTGFATSAPRTNALAMAAKRINIRRND